MTSSAALSDYLTTFRSNKKGDQRIKRRWFVTNDMPFRDFCKEVVEPGTSSNLPSGGVGIRCDLDFWTFALLPYHFRDVSCADIVRLCWPNIKDPQILPDSGSYWWTATFDETLEVPGEPFEIWYQITYEDGTSEERRMETFCDREKADKSLAGFRASVSEDHILEAQIRQWSNRTRAIIATRLISAGI